MNAIVREWNNPFEDIYQNSFSSLESLNWASLQPYCHLVKEEQYVVAIEEVVNRVVESKSLDADEETRHFQGWYCLVNTFGTEISKF